MYAVQLAYARDPDGSGDSERVRLRPAHRERLAGLAADGKLLAAGPWPDDSGALLVYLVEDRDELDRILTGDPYYSAPGVTVASVQEWNPVTRHPALDGL